MKRFHFHSTLYLLCSASFFMSQRPAWSETPAANTAAQAGGQHDFDFEIGTWKIHLKKLDHPLTGSHNWAEFDGTSVTRRMWDGGANIEEFVTDGPSGHVEGLTLRLYNPQSHQWAIFWASRRDGILGIPPMTGEFKDGRGEFYDQEVFEGKMIYVRYVWSNMTANSAHFEQSFSTDGGKTWEPNWITDQTRVKPQTADASASR
jgi:hypothetical protein